MVAMCSEIARFFCLADVICSCGQESTNEIVVCRRVSGTSKSMSRDGNQEFLDTSTQLTSVDESVSSSTTCELQPASKLRIFTYNELKIATRNFRIDCLLGEGGFGSVYKGWIDGSRTFRSKKGSGFAVAVKKMNNAGSQGFNEWMAELKHLGQLQHDNLVTLIGFCMEDDCHLLVYEYMAKGSLENHLFRRGGNFQPPCWNIRIKIAIDAAMGLAYLHRQCPQVIFRDLKASNILIDSNYNTKLSDFGLATYGPTGDNTHVSTRVIGTYGYAAPEYISTGHLQAKSDVYSFGVVLLEILTGRRAIDNNRPKKERNLVDWAQPYLCDKHKVFTIMDARMEGRYPRRSAYMAAKIASQCIQLNVKSRPCMNKVVEMLQNLPLTIETKRQIPTLSKNASDPGHGYRMEGLCSSRSMNLSISDEAFSTNLSPISTGIMR